MKIKIAKVHSEILEETKIKPVAEKNGQLFIGHLFFKDDECCDEKVVEVLEEVEIADDSSNVEIAKALQPLNEKYEMDGKDTFQTNAHWAWMNGLAESYDDSYLGI